MQQVSNVITYFNQKRSFINETEPNNGLAANNPFYTNFNGELCNSSMQNPKS